MACGAWWRILLALLEQFQSCSDWVLHLTCFWACNIGFKILPLDIPLSNSYTIIWWLVFLKKWSNWYDWITFRTYALGLAYYGQLKIIWNFFKLKTSSWTLDIIDIRLLISNFCFFGFEFFWQLNLSSSNFGCWTSWEIAPKRPLENAKKIHRARLVN